MAPYPEKWPDYVVTANGMMSYLNNARKADHI
jgi:hypothetical protein